MFFSGTAARRIENTAETLLVNFIQGQLNDVSLPYKAELASFGGADVVTADQEETRAEQNGRPCIVLDLIRIEREATQCAVDDGNGGTTVKHGTFAVFSYRAECVASEYSGALVGVENPVAADEMLAGHLVSIIDEGFDALAALGLEEAEIAPLGESRTDDDMLRINAHQISFAVTTVNS